MLEAMRGSEKRWEDGGEKHIGRAWVRVWLGDYSVDVIASCFFMDFRRDIVEIA